MSNLYLPGARIIRGADSGPMLGGPRKVVWHTTENDPKTTTAANVANYLLRSGNTVHLLWHPLTGETVQMIPADRGGKGLENRPGGVETNRAGTYVIQIEVVGRASQPFTDGPCVGLPKIQAWLASLGIPAVWSGTEDRSAANWAKGGHHGHMDVPENSHTDPGRVNKAKLAAARAPVAPSRSVVRTVISALKAAVTGKLAITGVLDAATTKRLQRWANVTPDGVLGPNSWRHIQAKVNVTPDGVPGPNTWVHLQRLIGATPDGAPGPDTYRHLQTYLNR